MRSGNQAKPLGRLRRVIKPSAFLMLVCLLSLFGAFLFFAGPVQASVFITSSPLLPQGQIGVSYYAVLTANGDNPPFTWTASGLPPGLSLAASGTISGSPTMSGTFNFSATVTNGASETASQTFVISVSQPPLKFLTSSLSDAKENEAYAGAIQVTGGQTPYTYSVVSGTFPTGLTLNSSTGYISGTPSQGSAGDYTFTIEATDSSSPTVSGQQSFSLTVEKGGYTSVITVNARSQSRPDKRIFRWVASGHTSRWRLFDARHGTR